VRPGPSDRPLRWDVGGCADGEPKLRPPKRDVTTRMLLHTAGFGWDFQRRHGPERVGVEKETVLAAEKNGLGARRLMDRLLGG
jgi:methyl acetate hydrolase